MLAGAKFAHERGIIHRDLKPQNVLVDREGRARVADFGIARAGASEITQTGSVLGTAQYLSPEQAQGLETTATSDLYSIGVMLYEALTGRVPFEADSAGGGGAQADLRAAAPAVGDQPAGPAGARRGRAQGARQGSRRSASRPPTSSCAALDAAEARPGAPAALGAVAAAAVDEADTMR